MQINMNINGEAVSQDVEARKLLVHFIRDDVGLTGTHWGCDTSNCGTCVVLIDGEQVKSCTTLAAMTSGHDVTTVEGLEVDQVLDPVQEGFMQCHGLQCGFCTPGVIMSAKALLNKYPNPTEDQINEGMAGVLCRCTGHIKVKEAIRNDFRLRAERLARAE